MTVPEGTIKSTVVYAMFPITVTIVGLNEQDSRTAVQAWLDGGPKHPGWTIDRRTEGGYITHADNKIKVPGRQP